MKKLLFVAIAFAGLALVSCNKDQAAVKKLDGNWTVDKMVTEDQGVSFDFIALGGSASMTFTKCKLKTDEWCTGSMTTTFMGATDTENMVYRVTGDGMTLEQKEHADSTDVISITIDELTKTTFKGTQTEGTAVTTIEATKN